MILIQFQENPFKMKMDLIQYDKNSIRINGDKFNFEQGKDLLFNSPHDQIIDPFRDSKGILHAKVIKQYNSYERNLVQQNSEKLKKSDVDNSRESPKVHEIKKFSPPAPTKEEIIAKKESKLDALFNDYKKAEVLKKTELMESIQAEMIALDAELEEIRNG